MQVNSIINASSIDLLLLIDKPLFFESFSVFSWMFDFELSLPILNRLRLTLGWLFTSNNALYEVSNLLRLFLSGRVIVLSVVDK